MRTQSKLLFASIPGAPLAPIYAALALLALASLLALAAAFWPLEETPFASPSVAQDAAPAGDAATAASPPAGEEKASKSGWVWM